MIVSFKDKGTCDIAKGISGKAARRTLPIELHSRARRLLAELDFALILGDLSRPSNRLHSLKADRKGQYSLSINDQYRICFFWQDGEVFEVEITDYH